MDRPLIEPLAIRHLSQDGIERYRSGDVLFGDDFAEADIREWYEAEKHGYFELVEGTVEFGYGALHRHHFFGKIRNRIPTCLAMGCADGTDVADLAPLVDKFIAIEPAREWWSDTIAGKPAVFLMPELDGSLALETGSVDCVTCFGVLHHIPNVSQVLTELVRVLRPGGLILIREPGSSMGDWRRPRAGVTPNERGIAKAWMISRARKLGLEAVSVRPCLTPITSRLARLAGQPLPFQSRFWVGVDGVLSRLLQPLDRYWRERKWQKMAPGGYAYIFRKTEGPTS